MNIGELFIALGFDVDDTKLKEFNDNIKEGYKGLLKVSAVAVGALYALDRFVDGSIRGAVALQNFKIQTGGSIEELQKWQVAASLSNTAIGVEQVTASITALQGAIADVAMGKGGGPFAMLGIDVRGKDAFSVLEEMRNRFQQNVNDWGLPQTIKLMSETGIDPGLVNALQLTREEFDKLAAGRFLNGDSLARLVELGKEVADVKMQFSLWKDQFTADMAPGLIQFLNTATPLVKDFAASFVAVGEALKEFWDYLGPVQPLLIGFAAALVAAFMPMTALFVALAAAIWDIGRAIRGLPSFTGGAWDWIKKIATDPTIYNMLNDWEDRAAKRLQMQDKPFPFESPSAAPQAAGAAAGVNIKNDYHITGTDPFTTANEINVHQQRQLNNTNADFNNGPRY